MLSLAPAVCLGAALLAGFLLCRSLACASLPALLGAATWAFSDPMLRPELLDARGGWPGPSLVLPFAVAGAFARSRARWPFLGLAAVCLVLRWRTPSGAAPPAFGALDALVLAVLAALGAQRLWDGEGGPAFLFGAAAVATAFARSVLQGGDAGVAAVELVPVAAAIVVVSVLSRETRARSGLVALFVLVGAERALELGLAPRPGAATANAATPARR